MDSKKIGKVIAKRRKEKGMTQGELAERLSVSNKTISKWETGVGLPDISILVDLASVLDISVDDLLKGKENKVQNALCEKNFLIKKKYYKKYLRDHFFESKAYWLFYRNYVYLRRFCFFTTSTIYSSLCRYSW